MKNDITPIDMQVCAVGIVRSEITTPTLTQEDDPLTPEVRTEKIRDFYTQTKSITAELIIDEALVGVLEGIEGFSHIVVLFWPHLLPPERRKIYQVYPRGQKDIPLKGVFATCSPARPNPILMTVVRLVGRQNNILRVAGLDAVDGSPILDIKPYTHSVYENEATILPDWIKAIQEDLLGGKP